METKGGGEIRRLHIIYFLSHMGRGEHPHLIRVHHLARNGVYLRDVKRWLGELRGKDLPETFAWSYKRRYKTGYVWQDLLDDDLITPISDNEYVLKGSQINPTPFEIGSPNGQGSAGARLVEKKSPPQVQVAENKVLHQQQKQQQCFVTEEQPRIEKYPDSKTGTPTKLSSEISRDSSLVFSSDRSTTLTDDYDTSKVEEEENKHLETEKRNLSEQNHEKTENYSLPSLYHNLLSKKSKKQQQDDKDDQDKTDTHDSSFSTSSSSSSQSSFTKNKSHSSTASSVFRNWITCGTVDTDDSAVVMMKSPDKSGSKKPNNKPEISAEICKGDKLGGSARCFGTSWNHHHQQQRCGARRSFGEDTNKNKKKLGELMNQTHKPICSLCGKSFKPEKMHKHMKSCRGMKNLETSAAISAEKTQPHRSSTSSVTDYLLIN